MRYAIYFIPDPASPLWAFGSSVIGYDSAAGADVPFPTHGIFRNPDARSWTEAPRKYGFHATLKAPFRLIDGVAEAELLALAARLAEATAPVRAGPLAVSVLDDFIALTPERQGPGLTAFAGACVEAFEPLRAPLAAADRARRLKSPLTPQEIGYLDRWGYPYVFDRFRFHMTLSGRLAAGDRTRFAEALTQLYAPIAQPLTIDAFAVCRQPAPEARFTVIRRFQMRA